MRLNKDKVQKIFLKRGFSKEIVAEALSAKKYRRIIPMNWHLAREQYDKLVDIPFCIKMYREEHFNGERKLIREKLLM